MARSRAADHEEKRRAMLRGAARAFAAQGYDRASIAAIAQELGVSKALLYHYYPSKEALLFDIVHEHLVDLVEAAEGADDATLPPRARLGAVIAAVLDCYRGADDEHRIQIAHLGQLPEERQALLKALERRLVAVVARAVGAVAPELPPEWVKPVTMSLFGTLNWKYMWFREGGAVTREAYAAMVTDLFLDGIAGVARRFAERLPLTDTAAE